jgi:hypothetical protein
VTSQETEREVVTAAHRAFALVGALLLLAVGLFVLASPLVAPLWGTLVLWVAWITAVALAVRNWRRSMFASLIAGGAAAAFWVAFLLLGELLFGWSA